MQADVSEAELENLLKQVRRLNPVERRRVREILNASADDPMPATAEERFDQLLLRDGLVDSLPESVATPQEPWEPVPIQGKPLSQTIIEERR